MGEAVSYLPDDLKARYSQIPWQDIKDMRNIPALEPALRQILDGV